MLAVVPILGVAIAVATLVAFIVRSPWAYLVVLIICPLAALLTTVLIGIPPTPASMGSNVGLSIVIGLGIVRSVRSAGWGVKR